MMFLMTFVAAFAGSFCGAFLAIRITRPKDDGQIAQMMKRP